MLPSITVTAIPSAHYAPIQPVRISADLRELWVGRMRHRVVHEPGELGMRDERAEGVEHYGRSMLAGSLRVDQIAELVELEVGRDDASHCPCSGALRVIIGVPMLNEA